MDGTFFGEQFDNAIRIAITKKENPEFMQEIDEEALIEEYARKKGYVKSDERVYVDITPGQEE